MYTYTSHALSQSEVSEQIKSHIFAIFYCTNLHKSLVIV